MKMSAPTDCQNSSSYEETEEMKTEEMETSIDDVDEEERICKKVRANGTKYLVDIRTLIAYHYETLVNLGVWVQLGKWNEETNQLELDLW